MRVASELLVHVRYLASGTSRSTHSHSVSRTREPDPESESNAVSLASAREQEKSWSMMSSEEQRAAETLGWSSASWDDGEDHALKHRP